MFKLNIEKESYWIDLPLGVRFHVKPAKPAIMVGARYKTSSNLTGEDDFGSITSNLVASIGELSVIGWEGVGDADGKALECTPENVRLVLESSWQMAEAFDKTYLSKFFEIENEKNV